MDNKHYKIVDEKTEKIFKKVIDCAFLVHSNLGPGLLESTYEKCLSIELKKANLNFEAQRFLDIKYKDEFIRDAYRVDILVENSIIVELKAVENINNIHLAQVLTYLKLGDYRLGLLVNFNVKHLKNGIKRVIN